MHPHQPSEGAGRVYGSPGRLHVILHGLFVFRERGDMMEALIPDMGHEHAYLGGTWLAETHLMDRTNYLLSGVNRPKKPARFSSQVNIVLAAKTRAEMADHGHQHGVYATLLLPCPEKIESLGRIPLNPDKDLGGDDKPKVKARAISTVQVLTYSFDNDALLRLGDHQWEPVPDADGCVNLHVFSEPERHPNHNHMRLAFQVSAALLTGASLTLRRPPGLADLAAEEKEIPPGIHRLELEDLIQRRRRLQVLGQAIRQGGETPVLWNRFLGYAGGNHENCPSGMMEESGEQ